MIWFTRLSKLCSLLYWCFKHRKPILTIVDESDKIMSLCTSLQSCTSATQARTVLSDILNINALTIIVKETPTETDDIWLKRIKAFVADNAIFELAWRITNGDFNFKTTPSRKRLLIGKIQKILPFANMHTIKETESDDLSDVQVEGIAEIVGIVQLLLIAVPKIISIMKTIK
jgi:hypothetical protein